MKITVFEIVIITALAFFGLTACDPEDISKAAGAADFVLSLPAEGLAEGVEKYCSAKAKAEQVADAFTGADVDLAQWLDNSILVNKFRTRAGAAIAARGHEIDGLKITGMIKCNVNG